MMSLVIIMMAMTIMTMSLAVGLELATKGD